MNTKDENRRDFLRRAALAALAVPLWLNGRSEAQTQTISSRDALALIRRRADRPENCGNWCGSAHEAPDDVSWRVRLADEKDAGEALLITGTVYAPDGRTPAPNVLIYAYHTNVAGYYGRGGGEHPHGRHHGWMLTDARGRYELRTVKPGQYPLRDTPAHIHYTLAGIDFKEDWIDDVWFDGDDLITPEIKRKQLLGKGGFNSILRLEKGADGILRGTRDIRLWKV